MTEFLLFTCRFDQNREAITDYRPGFFWDVSQSEFIHCIRARKSFLILFSDMTSTRFSPRFNEKLTSAILNAEHLKADTNCDSPPYRNGIFSLFDV